jgi:hypothetical protein
MKQSLRWITAIAIALALAGGTTASAAQAVGDDTAIDRMGDWFATLGKEPAEKEVILAKRRAERNLKRTGEAAREGAQEAGESLERASDQIERDANRSVTQ